MTTHHEAHCNADHHKPVGCDMCSCQAGLEIKHQRARIEQLEAMIQCLIDNHDHGSYESEGQAFDEARVLLAGREE